jgi:hypothetical protein
MKKLLHYSTIVLLVFVLSANLLAQNFSTGKMTITLSDAGRIRIKNNSADTTMIDRISVFVAGLQNQVFTYNADADVVSGDSSYSITTPTKSDYEIRTSCDNSYSALPPNVKVNTNVYGWKNVNYAIVKMVVTNNESSSLNARFGLEVIPEIDGAYGFETVKLDNTTKTVLINTIDKSSRVGIRFLSSAMTSLNTIDWVDSYDTNDVDMWKWVTTGKLQSTYTSSSADGVVSFISADTQTIATNGTKTYYFAVAYASTETNVLSALQTAQTKYTSTFTAIEKTKELPGNFNLSQNYPNPFNPSTKINFAVPSRNNVSLKVYNTLGQQVAELVNQALEAGSYSVDFNAGSLPSGVYVYTLTNGLSKVSNKMMLIK